MIILLNGSINSGKSTVAKILKARIGNTAVVEIDTLSEFIDWIPLEESIPINLENAASVTKNLTKRGINVILPYPLSKKDYDFLINDFETLNQKIHVVTLSPELEVALNNRGQRELDDWERDRIKYHYEQGVNCPSFGVIIDNSRQTPQETVNQILDYIK
ncbi:MAG: hypothetical protein HY677_00185 [Chloroflexi bacterium]|nr:hypothetical protein [Chloroflexota bacterium]